MQKVFSYSLIKLFFLACCFQLQAGYSFVDGIRYRDKCHKISRAYNELLGFSYAQKDISNDMGLKQIIDLIFQNIEDKFIIDVRSFSIEYAQKEKERTLFYLKSLLITCKQNICISRKWLLKEISRKHQYRVAAQGIVTTIFGMGLACVSYFNARVAYNLLRVGSLVLKERTPDLRDIPEDSHLFSKVLVSVTVGVIAYCIAVRGATEAVKGWCYKQYISDKLTSFIFAEKLFDATVEECDTKINDFVNGGH